jgi:hypothetical protein
LYGIVLMWADRNGLADGKSDILLIDDRATTNDFCDSEETTKLASSAFSGGTGDQPTEHFVRNTRCSCHPICYKLHLGLRSPKNLDRFFRKSGSVQAESRKRKDDISNHLWKPWAWVRLLGGMM